MINVVGIDFTSESNIDTTVSKCFGNIIAQYIDINLSKIKSRFDYNETRFGFRIRFRNRTSCNQNLKLKVLVEWIQF